MRKPLITIEEFEGIGEDGRWFGRWLGARLEHLEAGRARMRLAVRDPHLREGGSVAGPILMAVADIGMYAAVMSVYEHGYRAVTSDMAMHFLRRPVGTELVGDAYIVKEGRRLATCRVEIFVDDQTDPVAHIVGTYAIPDN